MKASLVVTGGFTGIGGRWDVDPTSAGMKSPLAAGGWHEFEKLVTQARSEGIFGEDYTAKNAIERSGMVADGQTYELVVDGKSVKWTEPAPAGSAAAPESIRALKRWITSNAKRMPFRPR